MTLNVKTSNKRWGKGRKNKQKKTTEDPLLCFLTFHSLKKGNCKTEQKIHLKEQSPVSLFQCFLKSINPFKKHG